MEANIVASTTGLPQWLTDLAVVLQAATGIATTIIALLALRHIRVAKEQNRLANEWNRLNATFSYFAHREFAKLQQDVNNAFSAIKVEFALRKAPITDAEIQLVVASPVALDALKHYLNYLEVYAIAIRRGALDYEAAYRIMVAVVARTVELYGPFIKWIRIHRNDDGILQELEMLATEWGERRGKELDQIAARQRSQKRELLTTQAVRPNPVISGQDQAN